MAAIEPMLSPTEQLAEQAEALAAKFRERRTFDEARAALNEAGMTRSRASLDAAVDLIDVAQNSFRKAQDAEREAEDAVKKATSEAEWMLAGYVVVEGNKRFVPDDGCRRPRRQVTAEEAKAWVADGAAKQASVIAAAEAARKAQSERQRCSDEINLAERTFSARKADLAAAVATVELFASSLRKENAS